MPASANGASSFHLLWDVADRFESVSTVLTVENPPAVDQLYFWALQVSFGSTGAGAHVGLQWLPPGRRRAANWGGYGASGSELAGSPGPNTQPYPWEVGVAYRLSVARAPSGRGWRGSISPAGDGGGGAAWLRDLDAPGDWLSSPMVWSEVFAECDASPVRVRWTDLSAVTAAGAVVRPRRVQASYQAGADGGCPNTDSFVEAGRAGLLQATSVARTTPSGAWLDVQA